MNERELLAEYRPWLRRCAASMTTPSRAEDLAQEGWIALWRAQSTYDGSAPLDWWLKRKAHGRMLTVLRDWTTNKQQAHVWADDVTELIDLAEALGSIELAYHRGVIYRALNALTPREREYVYLRFWCGWKKPQMVEHFGYEPTGLWRRSKIKLTESLRELEPLIHG